MYGGDKMNESIVRLSNMILSIWKSTNEDEIFSYFSECFKDIIGLNKAVILFGSLEDCTLHFRITLKCVVNDSGDQPYRMSGNFDLMDQSGMLTYSQLLTLCPEMKTILDSLQTDYSLYNKYGSLICFAFLSLPHFKLSELGIDHFHVLMAHTLAALERLRHNRKNFVELIRQLKPVTSSQEDPREIISRLLRFVGLIYNAEAGIMLFETQDGELVLQSPSFNAQEADIRLYRIRIQDEGNASRVFVTGKGYFSNCAEEDPNIIQRFVSMYHVKNIATVPIHGESTRLGVLHVINRKDRKWVSEDLDVLQLVASQIGYVLDNARLLQQISYQKEQAEQSARILEEQKHIIEQQRIELAQSLSLHHLFTDVLISGQGLAGIVNTLAEKLQCSVTLLDEYKKELITEQANLNPDVVDTHDYEGYRSIQVEYMGQKFGFIILTNKGPDEPWDQIAIEQAKMMICLELMHQKSVRKSERQKKGDFLAKLIQESNLEEETLLKEGLELGHTFRSSHFFVVIEEQGSGDSNPFDFIQSILERMQIQFLGFTQLHRLILLISTEGLYEEAVHTHPYFADRLQREILQHKSDLNIHLGFSRPYRQLKRYHEGYKEALKAVTLAKRLGRFYVDIQEYDTLEMLLDIHPSSSHHYVMKVIGPLIVYDSKKRGVLIQTLREYLNCNGNLAQAADACYAHINTVRYRLAKVEELLECDLRNHKTMFELQLALHLHQLNQNESS
jgi:sugar diacid utilization regulator